MTRERDDSEVEWMPHDRQPYGDELVAFVYWERQPFKPRPGVEVVCPECFRTLLEPKNMIYGRIAHRVFCGHEITPPGLRLVEDVMRQAELWLTHGRRKTWRAETNDGKAGRVRSEELDNAESRDWMAGGGWHIENAGATGNPVGRPAKGIIRRERLGDVLAAELDPLPLQRAVRALRRGRPANGEAADRETLAIALARLYSRHPNPNRAALADLLECSHQTIGRLISQGHSLLDRKSPKGGEDTSASTPTVIPLSFPPRL